MKIALIGAGNGGQAMTCSLAAKGHEVRLFNRSPARLQELGACITLSCIGAEISQGKPALLTTDLREAIKNVELIIVTTTADAHASLAAKMAMHLQGNETILLMPGRTGGALEVRRILRERGVAETVKVAETQSLVYACRVETPGRVRIIGVKSRVPVAAYPSADTSAVVTMLRPLYACMEPAAHVLETSFSNVGAIFHPAIVLFNASAIERGTLFYFYKDTTVTICDFLEKLDDERLQLANAYGVDVMGVRDWIKYVYPMSKGETLWELMQSNSAYHDILAPSVLNSRLLSEDIPMGLVPFVAFGEAAGINMVLTKAIVKIFSSLLDQDYFATGRTLQSLGLNSLSPIEILRKVRA